VTVLEPVVSLEPATLTFAVPAQAAARFDAAGASTNTGVVGDVLAHVVEVRLGGAALAAGVAVVDAFWGSDADCTGEGTSTLPGLLTTSAASAEAAAAALAPRGTGSFGAEIFRAPRRSRSPRAVWRQWAESAGIRGSLWSANAVHATVHGTPTADTVTAAAMAQSQPAPGSLPGGTRCQRRPAALTVAIWSARPAGATQVRGAIPLRLLVQLDLGTPSSSWLGDELFIVTNSSDVVHAVARLPVRVVLPARWRALGGGSTGCVNSDNSTVPTSPSGSPSMCSDTGVVCTCPHHRRDAAVPGRMQGRAAEPEAALTVDAMAVTVASEPASEASSMAVWPGLVSRLHSTDVKVGANAGVLDNSPADRPFNWPFAALLVAVIVWVCQMACAGHWHGQRASTSTPGWCPRRGATAGANPEHHSQATFAGVPDGALRAIAAASMCVRTSAPAAQHEHVLAAPAGLAISAAAGPLAPASHGVGCAANVTTPQPLPASTAVTTSSAGPHSSAATALRTSRALRWPPGQQHAIQLTDLHVAALHAANPSVTHVELRRWLEATGVRFLMPGEGEGDGLELQPQPARIASEPRPASARHASENVASHNCNSTSTQRGERSSYRGALLALAADTPAGERCTSTPPSAPTKGEHGALAHTACAHAVGAVSRHWRSPDQTDGDGRIGGWELWSPGGGEATRTGLLGLPVPVGVGLSVPAVPAPS
jgi:hypothetical protein